MYMLVLQTFLLMMAAFLLGATFACLLKRTFHRVDDVPGDALHVEVPPAVSRSPSPVAAPAPPIVVSREETQRFERALHGEVAEVVAVAPSVRQAGPVIEVQPLPQPPAAAEPAAVIVAVEAPRADAGRDLRSYAEIAVASHDGSMLPPAGVVAAILAAPVMPGPAPEVLPVPLVDIPKASRPADAPDGPDRTYTEEAVRGGHVFTPVFAPEVPEFQLPEAVDLDHYDVPPAGESYASIAVGGGKPAAPASATQGDADLSYAEEAVRTGHVYVASPEQDAAEFEFSTPADPDHFTVPPDGASYASVAVGGSSGGSDQDLEVSDGGQETTLTTAALASAAGIAAQRAASAGSDDLTRIQGVDAVLASRLHYAGVTRFAEIAAWNADDVRRMSQTLGFFGRIQDEYWIDQARELSGRGRHDGPVADGAVVASDAATAAAAAAAAAMAASTAARRSDATPGSGSAAGEDGAPDADAHATPFVAAEIATAAAAAAAAAMAASAATRRVDPAPDAALDSEDGGTGGRPGLAGLRSVRSDALLGDDAPFVRGDLDDLKRIRGIGVLIEKKLNSLGITSYEQVANWSSADVERISEVLDFKGRIERENWIEQARILASGGQTEFSRRVDRGEA